MGGLSECPQSTAFPVLKALRVVMGLGLQADISIHGWIRNLCVNSVLGRSHCIWRAVRNPLLGKAPVSPLIPSFVMSYYRQCVSQFHRREVECVRGRGTTVHVRFLVFCFCDRIFVYFNLMK